MYLIKCICKYMHTPCNPHRLDHKGTGVKVTSIYVTITHTVSTTRALVSRLLRYIRYM